LTSRGSGPTRRAAGAAIWDRLRTERAREPAAVARGAGAKAAITGGRWGPIRCDGDLAARVGTRPARVLAIRHRTSVRRRTLIRGRRAPRPVVERAAGGRIGVGELSRLARAEGPGHVLRADGCLIWRALAADVGVLVAPRARWNGRTEQGCNAHRDRRARRTARRTAGQTARRTAGAARGRQPERREPARARDRSNQGRV
jgi:hypothetical protein